LIEVLLTKVNAGLDPSVQNSAAIDVSLGEYAYGRIVEMMLSGALPAGEVLQERHLGQTLAVSRTPIREALTRLEAESLVTRLHGRVHVSDTAIDTYIHLLDLRRTLEIEVAGRATGKITAEQTTAIVEAINDLLKQPMITPSHHWAVDEMVHGSIAEAAGNPMMSSTIRDLRRRTHIFNTARIPHRLLLGASEHLELLNAVSGNDPDLSRNLMAQHLDNVKAAIIDYILGARGR
jgi:DNA-binding GntR family transcriptional regulator